MKAINQAISIFLCVASMVIPACSGKKSTVATGVVIDNAPILNTSDQESLAHFLDSLNMIKDVKLMFISIPNFEELENTDSLSESMFRRFGLSDKGGLIFVSYSTKSAKILVGSTINCSTNELDEITKTMVDSFKKEKYYDGLKGAYVELASKIN